MNSYSLSRNWFNWSFENPEKINPNHSAIYFFAIEHCNRLGWKKKFGFPTSMAKDAIGIKSYNTYIKAFNELIEWGFIKLIEKSKNQYSSNIIALSEYNKAPNKALDKALIKHLTKHSESTGESICSIDKQETTIQGTTIQGTSIRANHLFEKSEYYDYGKFEVEMDKYEKYSPFDFQFYHEALKNWSANGNLKKDWIGTAKNWMLRDLKDNKPKLKNQYQKQFNNGKPNNAPKTPAELLRETLELARSRRSNAADTSAGEYCETK